MEEVDRVDWEEVCLVEGEGVEDHLGDLAGEGGPADREAEAEGPEEDREEVEAGECLGLQKNSVVCF